MAKPTTDADEGPVPPLKAPAHTPSPSTAVKSRRRESGSSSSTSAHATTELPSGSASFAHRRLSELSSSSSGVRGGASKAAGVWSSDAYRAYLRKCGQDVLTVARAVCSSEVDDLATDFLEIDDELDDTDFE